MNNFNTENLNLNLLQALYVLLLERSLTMAGEKLGLSQSSMSHYLKQLRLHYQDPLLVKGKNNSYILTPKAQSLLPALEKLHHDISKVFYPNETFIPENTKSTFNIAMPDYIAMVLLPNLLKIIRTKAPHASIIVHSLNHINHIDEFEKLKIDLAIGMYTNPPLGLKKQFLFSDKAVAVSCKKNPNTKKIMSIESFLQSPLVLIGYKPSLEGIYIDKLLNKNSTTVDIAAIVPFTLPILHCIPNSLFVSITLEKIAMHYCKILNLKTHAPPFKIPLYKASLYWHEKNHKDAEQIWLRTMVHEVAEKCGLKS